MLQEINEYLHKNIDLDYREFSLRCNELATNFLGVRVPIIRNLAKDIAKRKLSYKYYEENDFKTYENIIIKIENSNIFENPKISEFADAEIIS